MAYKETLCWTCKNATSMYNCCWAGGKPRDDWKAVKTVINPSGINSPQNKPVDTYRVIFCPKYKRG